MAFAHTVAPVEGNPIIQGGSNSGRNVTISAGLAERLEKGLHVLDVGCGRGKILNLLAEAFPKSRFVGFDLSEAAIAFARNDAHQRGNENVEFVARNLSDLSPVR